MTTDRPELLPDLEDVERMFFPAYKRGDADGLHVSVVGAESVTVAIGQNGESRTAAFRIPTADALLYRRQLKRRVKICLYDFLSDRTGRTFPWGSLTGIRPTRLAYQLLDEGVADVEKELVGTFRVSPERARLVGEVLAAQKGRLSDPARDVALYIHIPICPSRCYYCSFPTELASGCKCIDAYVDALCRDISLTVAALHGAPVTSVYVGGGTPTVLSAEQLGRVLSAVPYRGVECTVEAGRPDTIDAEKLAVMRSHGVTRVSVNPQTLSDETLARIGRAHTAADFLRALALVREAGFSINTDLIAGLAGEDEATFLRSVSAVIDLRPENITVHTLCAKRGSELGPAAPRFSASVPAIAAWTERARSLLAEAGYAPYYLYRQKNMLGNLENIGYALPGCACRNNIDTMEERVSVAACGSGAIGKLLFDNGRIERCALVKPVSAYLERFDEMMERKRVLLEKRFGPRA